MSLLRWIARLVGVGAVRVGQRLLGWATDPSQLPPGQDMGDLELPENPAGGPPAHWVAAVQGKAPWLLAGYQRKAHQSGAALEGGVKQPVLEADPQAQRYEPAILPPDITARVPGPEQVLAPGTPGRARQYRISAAAVTPGREPPKRPSVVPGVASSRPAPLEEEATHSPGGEQPLRVPQSAVWRRRAASHPLVARPQLTLAIEGAETPRPEPRSDGEADSGGEGPPRSRSDQPDLGAESHPAVPNDVSWAAVPLLVSSPAGGRRHRSRHERRSASGFIPPGWDPAEAASNKTRQTSADEADVAPDDDRWPELPDLGWHLWRMDPNLRPSLESSRLDRLRAEQAGSSWSEPPF